MKDSLEQIAKGHREVVAFRDQKNTGMTGYTEGPEDLARKTLNMVYPENSGIPGKGIKG